MSKTRREGDRRTFFGLSMVILGGLLFAAGVMVGRQLKIHASRIPRNQLEQIDERDHKKSQLDTDTLTFHEELSRPPKPRPDLQGSSNQPGMKKHVTKTMQEPTPVPTSAKPPPKPSHKPSPDELDGRSMSLQVASFGERSKAEQLLNKLHQLGYRNVEVLEGLVEGKTYFRVRVGPYTIRKAAEQIKESLQKNGLEALLVME